MASKKNRILGLDRENISLDKGILSRCESSVSGPIGFSIPSSNTFKVTVPKTHVVVMFEGWNAPWEEEGGKPIPINAQSTINRIRRKIIEEFNLAKIHKTSLKDSSLSIEAYATDTNDDVKDLAIRFIMENRKNKGKVIIYGYSWGGDTAVELAKDLETKRINVELLITIDSALGPFNVPVVRDRTIPNNVKMNINHYTTTPKSRIGSQGLPNKAEDSSKTEVRNISHTGPTHGQMDEVTLNKSVNYILDEIIGDRVCD